MEELVVLGVYIKERSKNALTVQSILTRYGCSIKTRIGLHEVSGDYCSTAGLILLELTGDPKEMEALENELRKIEDVEVQKMIFKK